MTSNRFTDSAMKAREMTNQQLSAEMSSRLQLSQAKFMELLPHPQDQKEFINLMQQVEAEATRDLKLSRLRDNVTTAGKVAFKLISGLV